MRQGQPISTEPFAVIEFIAACPKCDGQWVTHRSASEAHESGGDLPFYCPVCDMDFRAQFEME